MPAAAKTTNERILEVARQLLEKHGPEGVSMQAVAVAVGVRAPSLYKRFADRSALFGELERATLVELRHALEHLPKAPPKARLEKMARVYRRWAKSHPNTYRLIFQPSALDDVEAATIRGAAALPVIEALRAWLEKEDVLVEARVLTAFLHGFVSMENAGAFRLGPGIETAFETGIDTVLRGLR